VLLKLPAAIKINGVIFVHAGLTPETAGLGLDAINRRVGESLRAMVESIEAMDPLLGFPAASPSTSALLRRSRAGRTLRMRRFRRNLCGR